MVTICPFRFLDRFPSSWFQWKCTHPFALCMIFLFIHWLGKNFWSLPRKRSRLWRCLCEFRRPEEHISTHLRQHILGVLQNQLLHTPIMSVLHVLVWDQLAILHCLWWPVQAPTHILWSPLFYTTFLVFPKHPELSFLDFETLKCWHWS